MSKRNEILENYGVHANESACRADSDDALLDNVSVSYKQSEVGVIPEDWECAVLSTLLSDISMGPFGSDIKVSNFVAEGIPVLDGLNVRQEKLLDEFSKFVTEQKARSLRKAIARRGDVVVTHRGTIGQISYIPNNSNFEQYVISQSQFRASFKSFVIPQWVTAYFLSDKGSAQLLEGKGHTGVPAIAQPTTTFKKLKIPLPPLAEQRAIATALSDVDALIDTLDRLITKKRDIKQASMQQLLTGKTRLPGFEGEWHRRKLGEHVKFLNTASNPRADLNGDAPVAYLHYGDIHTNRRVFLDTKSTTMPGISYDRVQMVNRLQEGDLILVDASEDIEGVGKSVEITTIKENGVVAGLHTIAVRFNKEILADGFKAYLQYCPEFQNTLQKLAAGTKVLATNRQHIACVEICLPGVKEQEAIATVLSDMDAEIEALERRREKTKQIKQGMMQELLTGRTRLVDPNTMKAEEPA